MENAHLKTPIGLLEIQASSLGVSRIRFAEPGAVAPKTRPSNPHLILLLGELEAYFRGDRSPFSCPLDPVGTDFQKAVWRALAAVPFGTTTTYGSLAKAIGSPNASRAVGGANNRNPLPIVVPCHRVLGTNQSLVGYAGGLWRKEWLLEHEGVILPVG